MTLSRFPAHWDTRPAGPGLTLAMPPDRAEADAWLDAHPAGPTCTTLREALVMSHAAMMRTPARATGTFADGGAAWLLGVAALYVLEAPGCGACDACRGVPPDPRALPPPGWVLRDDADWPGARVAAAPTPVAFEAFLAAHDPPVPLCAMHLYMVLQCSAADTPGAPRAAGSGPDGRAWIALARRGSDGRPRVGVGGTLVLSPLPACGMCPACETAGRRPPSGSRGGVFPADWAPLGESGALFGASGDAAYAPDEAAWTAWRAAHEDAALTARIGACDRFRALFVQALAATGSAGAEQTATWFALPDARVVFGGRDADGRWGGGVLPMALPPCGACAGCRGVMPPVKAVN